MKYFLFILITLIFISCHRHRPEMIIDPPPVSTFKDTLNDAMKYLDGVSTTTNDKKPTSKWF